MAIQITVGNWRGTTNGVISGAAAGNATYAMWLRRDTDLNDYGTYWGTQGSNYLALISGSNNDNLRLDCNYDSSGLTADADPAGFVSMPLATWRYVAIVQTGTTVDLYYATLGDTTLTLADTFTVSTSSPNFTQIGVGQFPFFGVDGAVSMAYYRDWSTSLTQSQLEAEMVATTAVRTSGLVHEYRFANGALATDSSGNSNTSNVGDGTGGAFTADPTFTTTVNGTADGTFTYTGAATGTVDHPGTIASTFTYTAPAVGIRTVLGTADGSFAYAAPAAGLVTVLGQADGTFTYTAPASGTRSVTGTADGTFTFAGPAVGTVGNAATISGIAAAVFLFTAAAVGHRVVGVLEDLVDVTVVDTRIEASVL